MKYSKVLFYRFALLLTAASLYFVSLTLHPLSGATVPPGFTETTIPGPNAGNWTEAVGIIFEDNGRMYVWERTGRVWFKDPADASFTSLVDIREEVGDWEDHGFLGFALHPDFRVNGYIYLLYVVDRHHLLNFGTGSYSPTANSYNNATIGRLTRYTCRSSDGFRSIDPASRTVLIGETRQTGFPILSYTHGIGSLVFGEDGSLLVSCGDGATADTVDPGGSVSGSYASTALSDGIIRTKENIGGYRSQLVDCLDGKVLRINPLTGDGLPSNPYYDAANPRAPRSRVWALGLRNPFRMSIRPESGKHSQDLADPGTLYIGDVGWNQRECLRVITGPGQNAGWPMYEGLSTIGGYDGSVLNRDAPNPLYPAAGCAQFFSFRDLFKADTLNPAGQPPFVNPCNASQRIPSSIPQFLHTRPVLDWDHSIDLARTPIYDGSGQAQIANVGAPGSPVSGTGFSGNCAVGGTWYTGTAFALEYQNSYYFADWGQQVIQRLKLDDNDKPLVVSNFLSNAGAVVCIVQHPFDGSLYYVSYTFGDAGTVRKLSYTGNRTPVAVASANQYYGVSPLTVQFSNLGSTDPDGQALSYGWNFGDGSPTSTQPSPSHTFVAPAGVPTTFTVTMTVTDTGGLSAQATLTVSVNNTPPNVNITSPVDGSLHSVSGPTTINLAAMVNDAESANSQLTYQWQVLLHHNNHNHVVLTDSGQTASAVLSPIGCDGINIYYYRVFLTVTDPHGLVTTDEVRVYPDCGPNTPPTISDIADQTILIGSIAGPLGFTIGDSGVAAANLELSGASSNPTLVPQSGIAFGGSGSNRTVTISPAPNQNGTATITITVGDGPSTTSDSFQLTVTGNNTPPTISHIPDQTTPESTPTPPISFTVGDLEVPLTALTVSANSSNPGLVPPANIVFSGSGANRSLTITPAPGNGTATITVTVNDGQYSTSTNFVLTVSGVAASGTQSFTNATSITIPSLGIATPYPSAINVTAMGGTLTNVTVTLHNITHTWPADLDVLLVGPGGQHAMIFSDVGGGNGLNNVTVTLSDSAATSLTSNNRINPGTYKPTDVEPGETGNFDSFSAPAPAGPYTSPLSAFRGLNANGIWSLYLVDDGPGDQGSFAGGWSLTLTTVGGGPAAPTISDITDKSTTVDTPTAAIGLTVGDSDTSVNSLTLSGTSSNPTLVPNGNIVFGGTGANRTVTVTPSAGQLGTATITVTVSDGALNASDSFVLTVNGMNTAPTISDIADRTVNEDTGSGAITFTVGDGESTAASLSVSGTSGNLALVPNGNIVFGGSGPNRTVTVNPAANQSGVATITVNVSDGQLSASDSFVLTVTAVNDPPTISNISDQSTTPGTVVGPISFTVGDVESLGSLTVTGSSSNPTLIPDGNIVIGGSGANRTVTMTPVAGQTGTATITVNVNDGVANASDTFLLTVSTATSGTASFTNTTAIAIPHVGAATPYPSVINVSGMAGTISEVIVRLNGFHQSWPDDVDVLLVGPTGQKIIVMSDVGGGNAVTGRNFVLRDSAAAGLTRSGTLASGTFKPTDFEFNDTFTAPAPTGPYTSALSAFNGLSANGAWSLYAIDDGPGDLGGFAGGWSLTLTTVGGGPAGPTISDITDKSTTVDTPTAAIGFTVADADTPVNSLTVSGSSSNPALVPNGNIVFGGSGANRTVTVTPSAGQAGIATITVTVTDGALNASDTFVLTVNAAPTISDIAPRTVNEDTGTGAIAFTVGDGETAAGSLTVSGSSDNLALVPNGNIVFGGSGANRTVTITPAANQSGAATITVNVSDGQLNASDSFVLTVTAVNDPPTISNIANQTTTSGTAAGPISFTVGDVESLGSLTVSGSSDNLALVPNGNIVFGGSGANRTVTVTPSAGQTGTATITVTVSDGALNASDSFVLTVNATNTVPTISDIASRTVNEDTGTGAIAFTVGDGETAAGSLTVSGSSDNLALVPNGNIVFGGSGANRTMTISPATNQFGAATITVSVSDGQLNATDSFVLTVTALNDPPTISNIADQTTTPGTAVGPISFTVGDVESLGSLTVTGSSSNPSLVPDANIVFGGSGANRTVTVTPVAAQTGTATITVNVNDGAANATDTFLLTVSTATSGTASFTNTTAIVIPHVGAATPYPSVINVSGMAGTINEVIVRLNGFHQSWPDDVDVLLVGPTGQKIVVMSDVGGGNGLSGVNLTLRDSAAAGLTPGGTLTSGTFKPTDYGLNDTFAAPAPAGPYTSALSAFNGLSADGVWSLYAVDDGPGDQGGFAGGWSLTITTVGGGPAGPTISDITDKSTTVNTPTAAIPFTVNDTDTPVTSLTVSGSSSNPTLVPNGNIAFGGSGANRTVTVTPSAGQTGTATITVTVSDGGLNASDTFVLTVNAMNTAPTISDIANRTVNEDTGTGAIAFTVGDGESAAGSLSVSGSSDNLVLVPNGNIVFGGSGANRTVTITPAANQSGVATITVSVSDGQLNATDSFVLTVTAVNDPPTISNIADQTTTPGTAVGPISFTVGDVESLGSVAVTGGSSNPTLVPDGNIVFGGSGANRTVTVTPVASQTGTATITVNVNDGVLNTSDTFLLTVSTATAGTASFTNTTAIAIPHVGAATPYPSVINVTGMGGTISEVILRLNGFHQTWPDDVDVLLVGPTGQKIIVMSDVGGGNGVSGRNFVLRDSAATGLTRSGTLASGTFKPTDFEFNDIFTAPAPAGPYTSALSAFNGLSANGAWSLYAIDDGPGDLGGFAGGWSLTLTTTMTVPAFIDGEIRVPEISIARDGENGSVVLRVQGAPSQRYWIEFSVDLVTWEPLVAVENATGISFFTDNDADSRSQCFYRVVIEE